MFGSFGNTSIKQKIHEDTKDSDPGTNQGRHTIKFLVCSFESFLTDTRRMKVLDADYSYSPREITHIYMVYKVHTVPYIL